MHFSTQQQNAIDARGASILLSAAAGSGKTTVMIQRIMTMLSQGLCRADELLVLTFTRAASANMRTKLENALASALGENPDDPLLLRAAADRAASGDLSAARALARSLAATPEGAKLADALRRSMGGSSRG